MRKILSTISILFLTQFVIAQKGFTPKIEKYVNEYINTFDQSKSELKRVNTWYAAFKKAEKPSKKEFEGKLIGLGIEIAKENEMASSYLPATYTQNENKIAVEKINSKKHEQSLINDYAKAYFKNNTVLKKEPLYKTSSNDNFVFGATNFTENTKEIYVKGNFNLYFIRTYKNNLYVISINRNYNIWKNKAVTFYKFDLSLKNDKTYEIPKTATKPSKPKTPSQNLSYKIPNRWKGTNRLYHDVAIDELRETVRLLAQIPPYYNNKDFVSNAMSLSSPLTRDNVMNYISQLQFFENYKVELDEKMKGKIGYFAKESIKNVNHYAAHALADIFMTKKEYRKAISSFGKALNSKYHTAGGTRYIRCLGRIYSDLAEAAFALDKTDQGVLYLLALIAQKDRYSEYADEQLTAYGKSINLKKFKKSLILAIDSVEIKDELRYNITYRNQIATFEIPFLGTKKNIQIHLVKSDTYSYFENK